MDFSPVRRPAQEIISHCSIKCTSLFAGTGSGALATFAGRRAGDFGECSTKPIRPTPTSWGRFAPGRARRAAAIGQPLAGVTDNAVLRNLTAAYELIARAGLTHARPAFGIDSVMVGNREVGVTRSRPR